MRNYSTILPLVASHCSVIGGGWMWRRTDTISHDFGMQFIVILGCGLLSDWSTTSDGNEECTINFCLACVVAGNLLECFAKVKAEIITIQWIIGTCPLSCGSSEVMKKKKMNILSLTFHRFQKVDGQGVWCQILFFLLEKTALIKHACRYNFVC